MSDESVGDRKEWIMHLLYAPDKTGSSKPIHGRTRMMKACFLLDQKLREHFNKETDFDFIAHKYGPFDQGVYRALEQLDEANKITITPEDQLAHDRGRQYELTPSGLRKEKESYRFLSQDKQDLVEWIKYRQADRPLGALLSYVYSNYPSYTSESELV